MTGHQRGEGLNANDNYALSAKFRSVSASSEPVVTSTGKVADSTVDIAKEEEIIKPYVCSHQEIELWITQNRARISRFFYITVQP
jgi:hypothetical protein